MSINCRVSYLRVSWYFCLTGWQRSPPLPSPSAGASLFPPSRLLLREEEDQSAPQDRLNEWSPDRLCILRGGHISMASLWIPFFSKNYYYLKVLGSFSSTGVCIFFSVLPRKVDLFAYCRGGPLYVPSNFVLKSQ